MEFNLFSIWKKKATTKSSVFTAIKKINITHKVKPFESERSKAMKLIHLQKYKFSHPFLKLCPLTIFSLCFPLWFDTLGEALQCCHVTHECLIPRLH